MLWTQSWDKPRKGKNMVLYKLTNERGVTRSDLTGETHWREGQTLTLLPCLDPQLCSCDVIHAYRDPNSALLLNPVHAGFRNPLIWEAEGKVVVEDWGKVGCFALTTIKRIDYPEWYSDKVKQNRVILQLALLCVEAVSCEIEKEYTESNLVQQVIDVIKEVYAGQKQFTTISLELERAVGRFNPPRFSTLQPFVETLLYALAIATDVRHNSNRIAIERQCALLLSACAASGNNTLELINRAVDIETRPT